ncbi:amidase [Oryzicola mucosus]|uniref:Amidase n=1 Tax=Oryzicola mucosus TaxID=2767425 RepID=A0A8J6PJ13_9HYPH|nr:amidase [Oryzicola mucosus]MBD0414441.1 amidase [Oryzicola mucosus]
MTADTDSLNAFVQTGQTAVFAEKNGPLSGLRLAVKDIYAVAGMRTGCGNPDRLAEASPEERTAPAVQTMLDAGARFVGKTQTDELAFSLMGQNAHYPFPINPKAPERVTGGSSSGSAAAVAGGLADIAIGSDTGGSIRAPASFCGLIGLRTTQGRISLEGAMKLAPSLDTFGWFARDIDIYDKVARLLLDDEKAPALTRSVSIGWVDGLLPGDAERTEYRRMGGIVASVLGGSKAAKEFSAEPDRLYWAFRKIQAFEAWAEHGGWISAGDRALGPGVGDRFQFGATVSRDDYETEKALRAAFREEMAALLGSDCVVVMPTVPSAAPSIGLPQDELQAYRERALHMLCLSGLSGFPQITLPLGTVHGAPFGISLLGPAGSDLALIDLGRRILGAAAKE